MEVNILKNRGSTCLEIEVVVLDPLVRVDEHSVHASGRLVHSAVRVVIQRHAVLCDCDSSEAVRFVEEHHILTVVVCVTATAFCSMRISCTMLADGTATGEDCGVLEN